MRFNLLKVYTLNFRLNFEDGASEFEAAMTVTLDAGVDQVKRLNL